ncbi:MAG: AAA domain-containing protein, partial [Planctomycetota bacterium]|nr:AAA domain-containing protein [Planctomycetota bacterium]
MTPDNRIDVGQLRQRLRAWVAHESMSSRRALEETWAQSVAERVDGGYCAAGLRLASARNGSFAFDCREFAAKFREGEPLYLGGGTDIDAGWPVTFLGYDVATGRVRVAPDRFESREPMKPEPGEEYCLDRRGLGLERLLLEGLDSVFHKENAHTIEALTGRLGLALDDARHAAALAHGQQIGFTPAQSEALARATATEGLCLIQGPPGTGKTRVLAEAAVLLARRGCRLFVTGLTHRAVHNVLLAVRAIEPRVPVFKVGSRNRAEGLEGSGIATVRNLEHFAFPEGASIVGGTPFAVRRFSADRRFHFVLLDEAGQMPVVHGAIAMTQARRWVVVGDPKQLRPVFEGEGRDPLLARSLYSYLEDFGEGVLLDRTFRMNETLAGFASREFYEDRLDSADSARERELALVDGGPLRDILDPKKPLVIARVDHEGRRRRSPEEAELIVELVRTLRQHHAIPASEIAIIAPFRS